MEHSLDLTYHWAGFSALAIFVFAYALVMAEEFTHLRKSKPVVIAAGIIWMAVAITATISCHFDVYFKDTYITYNISRPTVNRGDFGQIFTIFINIFIMMNSILGFIWGLVSTM